MSEYFFHSFRSSELKRQLAVAYRKQCPEGRIIAVANQAVETLEVADSSVYRIGGPEVLIEAIRRNLERVESSTGTGAIGNSKASSSRNQTERPTN